MRRLFAAADIDFDQWKALTAAALKLDFRLSSVARPPLGGFSSGTGSFVFQVLVYTLLGLLLAASIWMIRDLFLIGTLVATYTIVTVGMMVLLDHNAAIASPSDYEVLGFRPIGSRTYFAVRLANVLAYATTVTTVVLWLPIAVLFLRHGAAVGAAGLVAFYTCSASTTLAIVVGYAWMMRVMSPEALMRGLSYVQLVMTVAVYGSYVVIWPTLLRGAIRSMTLPETPWLLLFPGAWFGAYLQIAGGKTGFREVAAASVSLIALAAMASELRTRLSLDYSERLGAMTAAAAAKEGARQGVRPGVWFTAGEPRAVALLVRGQFRSDQKFRLGVLSILPLTLVYILIGLHDRSIGDPFVRQLGGGSPLIMAAVMMIPSILQRHLTRSDAYRASWIFFASPANRLAIIRSAKNVVAAFFLAPYLLLLAALLVYLTGHPLHVLVHVGLVGLLSHLFLQLAVLVEPDLPFSRPTRKGQASGTLFGLFMAAGLVSGIFQILAPALYQSAIATAAAFLTTLLGSAAVDRLMRSRVERRLDVEEFEG